MNNTVHLILQGKGGVGKSLVSSLLCQYLGQKGKVIAFDTDPVNSTFAGYEDLPVRRVELLADENIDPRKFDSLIEAILSSPEGSQIVIDNGASTFIPLCFWLKENDTSAFLREAGVSVLLHTVVTGGQAQSDTLDGLEALIRYFESPLIVWLNQYFGKIAHQEKPFEEFKIYRENSHRIHSLIHLPQKTPQTFGRDLEELLSRRQTFEAAIASDTLPVMTRQRLKIFWKEICEELDRAQLLGGAEE